ncbi:MAG TPA: hypothetical protein VEZ20_07245 [Allosphingosinicella sp.]|nr:hypothetical protein [Allosphingosinicella sp.]
MIVTRLAAVLLAAFAGLAAAAPARAEQQAAPARDCSDDRGVDRCAEEQQRRTRALFGVRSIEEHRAANDEVRRVFYVDGYGRDVVAIAFVRAPGRDPKVLVHYPYRDGETPIAPLEAPVSEDVWNDVVERSANFHRSFADDRSAPSENGEITICLHSWVYTIEAVGRAQGIRPPQIRRKTEDACQDGPGEAFAGQLDRIARSLFPHCAGLDIDNHRNEAMVLSACRILRGDRLAAAGVLNAAEGFSNARGPDDARLLSGLFHDRATIAWGSERQVLGWAEAEAFWASRLQSGEDRAIFYFDAVEGLSAERARLTGSLSRPSGEGYQSAEVVQIWTRDDGGDWKVREATVGPWRRGPSGN